MSEPDPVSREPEQPPSPGQWFVYGLVCFVIGAVLFGIFYALEASGRGALMHWFIALLYTLGGKWLVGGIFGFLGAVCIVFGVMDVIKGNRGESS